MPQRYGREANRGRSLGWREYLDEFDERNRFSMDEGDELEPLREMGKRQRLKEVSRKRGYGPSVEENQDTFFKRRSQGKERTKREGQIRAQKADEQTRPTLEANARHQAMREAMEMRAREQEAHKMALEQQKESMNRKKMWGSRAKAVGGEVKKGLGAYKGYSDAVRAQHAAEMGKQFSTNWPKGMEGMQNVRPQTAPWQGAMRGGGAGQYAGAAGSLGGVAGGMSNAGQFYSANPGLATLPTNSVGNSAASGAGYAVKGAMQALWDQRRKADEIRARTGQAPGRASGMDYLKSAATAGEYPKNKAPVGPGSMGSFSTAAIPIWSLFGQGGENARRGAANVIDKVGGGINPFAWYKTLFGT